MPTPTTIPITILKDNVGNLIKNSFVNAIGVPLRSHYKAMCIVLSAVAKKIILGVNRKVLIFTSDIEHQKIVVENIESEYNAIGTSLELKTATLGDPVLMYEDSQDGAMFLITAMHSIPTDDLYKSVDWDLVLVFKDIGFLSTEAAEELLSLPTTIIATCIDVSQSVYYNANNPIKVVDVVKRDHSLSDREQRMILGNFES